MNPTVAHQNAVNQAASFVQLLNTVILFPFIGLLSGIALLVFIYGCFQYITNASNSSAREEGLKHITWGIIGLVIMLAAFAILNIAAGTFGLTNQLNCATNPTAAGCTGASNPFLNP